jgi:dTDP-4-dehydrorhamnose reductase
MLVTGGSGHLGQVVVEVARAAGWRVTGTAFTRPVPGTADVVLDVRDAAAVAALVADLRPAAVVHTAYVQDGPAARATIVDGSAAVAAAAAAAEARLVHVSTDALFDGRLGRPYVESDPPTPVTAYGAAKAEAERRVLDRHPAALVARTSLILSGPGRPPTAHERLAHDPDATHYTDEIRCPVQVYDLAAALVELCGPTDGEHDSGPGRDGQAGSAGVAGPLGDGPAGVAGPVGGGPAGVAGVLHVAGADALSRHELGTLLSDRPVRGAPAPPGRPLDCRLDSSLAAGLLRTRLRGAREVWAPARPTPPA